MKAFAPLLAALAFGAPVSSNWTGYVATGTTFRSVSGAWTEPKSICLKVHVSAAAFWVGLGGASSSHALEQIGTESDCDRSSFPEDSAWYELWPAPPRLAHMQVAPGDELTASVTVRGTHVTLQMKDRSTGASFTTTVRLAHPDVSSAEWIAEAPAVKGKIVTLSDFEAVEFSDAQATSVSGRTASIAGWHARVQELKTRPAGPAPADIVPEPLTDHGSAFTVRWQRLMQH